MDLRLLLAVATDDEKAAVDARLGPPASGWDGGTHDELVDGRIAHGGHEARDRRHLLLPALQAVQAHVGWISQGALNYICERLTVPPADAYGVATFYGLLSVNPRPERVLHVCEDIACKCLGSDDLIAALESGFGPEEEERDGAAWLRAPCLGQCDRGPAAMLTIAGESPDRGCAGAGDCRGGRGRAAAVSARSRSPTPRSGRPASPGCSCWGGSAWWTRAACTTTAPPVATRRCAKRSRWGPRR